MTTRYRVEYALKSHRRDEFIEWIKGLLVVPFILHSDPTAYITETTSRDLVSGAARQQYLGIMRDVERLIEDLREQEARGRPGMAKLRHLVPSVGTFFTPLPLAEAFAIVDGQRAISARRLVSPSFNDVRLLLNTAQCLALARGGFKLMTLDGDVTLYDDGKSLDAGSPVIDALLAMLGRGMSIGIVTAAGYSARSGERYAERLRGLLDALAASATLTQAQKESLFVMGGETNFLFRYSATAGGLEWIEPESWMVADMRAWREDDVREVLDLAEGVLESCVHTMRLRGTVVRKERAVGLVPLPPTDAAEAARVAASGFRPASAITREDLEEVVLGVQRRLENTDVGRRIDFCAFNGGSDVWVDIGDKRLGVRTLQAYLGNIPRAQTLHVGDQFASVGANDFKARLAACTVWIASPAETADMLQRLGGYLDGDVPAGP
ncbi:IMP-specific 5-nucleotidase [Dipodascopsis tothii]|uniref:IMP-specific 5-nucleotidase n=1 Tax=Dipodascopsis tothii TaxID=44089 RepID=UPI0034CD1CD6